jgi:hypothetical protein
VISLVRRKALGQSQDLLMLVLMASTFTVQLAVGFSHSSDPGTLGVQHTIAIIIVVSFLSGISRAWELTGARQLVLTREIGAMLLRRPAPGGTGGRGPGRPDDEALRSDGWAVRSDGWAANPKASSTGARAPGSEPAPRVSYTR